MRILALGTRTDSFGDRHTTYGTYGFFRTFRYLLRGAPNAAARDVLEPLWKDSRAYLDSLLVGYRDEGEDLTSFHSASIFVRFAQLEAPSLVIIRKLLEHGARLNVYDPVAMDQAKKLLLDDVVYARDRYEAMLDANALVVVTEWSEFRLPNYKVMNKLMREKVVFDGRNIYDAVEMNEQGFIYYGIGG